LYFIYSGDLNYRLDWGGQHDKETPTAEAFAAMCAEIEAEKFEELYQSDQLRREIQAGNVFHGFTDLQPKFKPTFKVERNELLKYKAQRLPAWCDRVLYRSLPKFHMNPTGFTMTPEILTSDHKPVRATFDIEVFDMPSGQDDSQGDAFMAIRGLKGMNLNAADLNGLSGTVVSLVSFFHIFTLICVSCLQIRTSCLWRHFWSAARSRRLTFPTLSTPCGRIRPCRSCRWPTTA
jgi:hypothetical protein